MARFKRTEKIGSGGFGEVWKAVRIEDNHPFAMKILSSDAGSGDIERFRREVRLLQSLDHPRIIKVIASHIMGSPICFWMPLFQGSLRPVLSVYVANARKRSELFSQILDGMAYAHSEGVIHRDLKPENILLDSCGNVAITDFGLGRFLDSDSTRKTCSGEFLGTPYYMAPEQVSDAKNADHRSDIYSLGRILYELCTGDSPAAQQDITKLDSGLRHLVAKATKHNPCERFQDIKDFKRDFDIITSGTAAKRMQDDVRKALGDIVESDTPTRNQIKALEESLLPHHQDIELVHEVFMVLPAKAFTLFFGEYPEIVRDLTKRFCDNVGTASWGFSYCDTISAAIMTLYGATTDLELRTHLLLALANLGISHNRFRVINLFVAVLEKLEDDGEILAIRDEFRKNPALIDSLQGQLAAASLPEQIQILVVQKGG